jgi:tetratricopeptide (TPR) repeat protein
LDPNFALVHQLLGRRYQGSLQPALAGQSFQKAYDLRDRLSLRHRLVVDASYYLGTTGELEKALQTFQDLLHTFPESGARTQLCYVLRLLGRFQQAVAVCREAIRFNRNEVSPFVNIISAYMSADQPLDAQALLDEAWAQGFSGDTLVETGYDLAFLRGDQSGMQDYFNRAMGKPELEDNMLSRRADNETYHGRLRNAQGFWQQAAESASRGGTPDIAAEWKAKQALLEAEVGSPIRARKFAAEALALREGHAVESVVALTLARSGDLRQAERLADKLSRDYPLDTLIQSYELPAIRASIELQKKRPAKAIEILEAATPYELAATALLPNVLPPYLRGQAYLEAGQGQQAAEEFQKVLAHPGLVLNYVTGALAHLQLGRAEVMMGDKAAARKSYQDFLMLWKDADPDIPIYKQAKAEYARFRD